MAVDQYQRGIHGQAAQRHAAGAARHGAAEIGGESAAVVGRQGMQHIGDGSQPAFGDVVAGEHIHRRRRFGVGATNIGAGNHNGLEARLRFTRRSAGLRGADQRQSQQTGGKGARDPMAHSSSPVLSTLRMQPHSADAQPSASGNFPRLPRRLNVAAFASHCNNILIRHSAPVFSSTDVALPLQMDVESSREVAVRKDDRLCSAVHR